MYQARTATVGGEAHQGVVQGAATSAGSLASILGLVVGAVLLPHLGALVFVVTAALFGLVAALTPVWFGRSA
jgi:predicted MFS family arabinose efflux permease